MVLYGLNEYGKKLEFAYMMQYFITIGSEEIKLELRTKY